MPRPIRTVDAETVRRLAAYAGLPLPEERVQIHVDLLNELVLPGSRDWENEKLGFWFEDRRLSFVRAAVVHRVPWEEPASPRKIQRPVPSEGEDDGDN